VGDGIGHQIANDNDAGHIRDHLIIGIIKGCAAGTLQQRGGRRA
jgi:hypothetical protein